MGYRASPYGEAVGSHGGCLLRQDPLSGHKSTNSIRITLDVASNLIKLIVA